MRAWTARRRLGTPAARPCAECHKPFTPKRRDDATLCSPKCKQQAYRNRQREMEAMHAIAVLATISDDELADLKNWRPSADRVLPI